MRGIRSRLLLRPKSSMPLNTLLVNSPRDASSPIILSDPTGSSSAEVFTLSSSLQFFCPVFFFLKIIGASPQFMQSLYVEFVNAFIFCLD